MKKETIFLIAGIVFLLAFAAVLFGVMRYDVKQIGPNGSSVGFSTLNEKFRNLIGKDEKSYLFSEYLGYCGLIVVAAIACQGLLEIIKGRSLKALKPQVLIYGIFCVILAALYVFFEKVAINYRPILVEGELESAFPSSHTLLAVFVFIAAAYDASFSVETKGECILIWIFFGFFSFLSVFTRILSGYHWLTDVLASLFLGISLVMFYIATCIHFIGEDPEEE